MAFEKSIKKNRQFLLPDLMATGAHDDLDMDDAAVAVSDQEDDEEAAKGITDENFPAKLAELKDQLQIALELEHSTIPPYLCALYSIKPGTNIVPAEIIKSVVLEEMLHMIMVANLINAVGGKPEIGAKETATDGSFIPNYPTHLPGGVDDTLLVELTYFSESSIDTFCAIEHPAPENEEKGKERTKNGYGSIGEFYKALLKNITGLEVFKRRKKETIFTGLAKNQVHAEHYYGAGGKLLTVSSLEDAKKVVAEIVGQGEGTLGLIFDDIYVKGDSKYQIFGEDVEEYAHYFRFKEVKYGCYYSPSDSAHRESHNGGLPTGKPFDRDWKAVCEMQPNPDYKKYTPGTPVYEKSIAFSKTYSRLLDNINRGCNGEPEVLIEGIQMMYQLRTQAVELMNIPLENGMMAGPTFQYIKNIDTL